MGFLTKKKTRHNCCIDALAKEIASMFDSGQQPLERPHQLYAMFFNAKKATLIRSGTKFLQFKLRCAIGASHYRFAQVEKWVEAEDYSELKIGQEEYEKYLADLVKAENINISWISDRDALLHLKKEFTAERTELEDIAAMTDFTEQAEALADYDAKEIVKEISHDLAWIAFGATLGTENIQRVIKTGYLDKTPRRELEELAKIFARDDIIEKCESAASRMDRMVRDDERRKLLTVLRHRIAHKDT